MNVKASVIIVGIISGEIIEVVEGMVKAYSCPSPCSRKLAPLTLEMKPVHPPQKRILSYITQSYHIIIMQIG